MSDFITELCNVNGSNDSDLDIGGDSLETVLVEMVVVTVVVFL